jgi:hypothetical protein
MASVAARDDRLRWLVRLLRRALDLRLALAIV